MSFWRRCRRRWAAPGRAPLVPAGTRRLSPSQDSCSCRGRRRKRVLLLMSRACCPATFNVGECALHHLSCRRGRVRWGITALAGDDRQDRRFRVAVRCHRSGLGGEGKDGAVMCWLVRPTLLVVIAVSPVADATRTIAKSMRFPATAAEPIAEHPLHGSWMEITKDGGNLYQSGQPDRGGTTFHRDRAGSRLCYLPVAGHEVRRQRRSAEPNPVPDEKARAVSRRELPARMT